MMAVAGFRADLDAVEVLFTSLLLQASRAMLAKGKVRDGRGRSRTRSFRQSFIVAFASRIGERLAAATVDARNQAEQELSTSLAVVLADRAHEVDDELARRFPHTRAVRGPSVTNEAGWHAGRVAAELATLGPDQATLEGMGVAGRADVEAGAHRVHRRRLVRRSGRRAGGDELADVGRLASTCMQSSAHARATIWACGRRWSSIRTPPGPSTPYGASTASACLRR